jgi:hypothetical protein
VKHNGGGNGHTESAALEPSARETALKNYLRRWNRRKVSVPAKLEIILIENGKRFTTGTAIMRNISLNGALLGRVVLKKAVLPAKRFKIHLTFNLRQYKGVGAVARPVHFGNHEKEFELGVEFLDLWIGTSE